MYLCHRKADPKSLGAAKRLGNRERYQITEAGAALPLHSAMEALESKNWEEGTQTVGRVHSVCTGHVTCFSEDSRVMSVSLQSAQSVSFSPPISHVASCYFHLSRWVV